MNLSDFDPHPPAVGTQSVVVATTDSGYALLLADANGDVSAADGWISSSTGFDPASSGFRDLCKVHPAVVRGLKDSLSQMASPTLAALSARLTVLP